MTTIKRAALVVILTFVCTLLANAQEQKLSADAVRVTTTSDKVHVAIGGNLFETRLEVASADGEIVFESGILSGNSFDWEMTDSLGERVAAGDYTLTITYRTPAGKLIRRTEQVTVPETGQQAQTTEAGPSPTAIGTITGEGTSGKISKFNGTNSITDSTVLTESAGKLRLVGALEIGATSGTGVSPTIVNPNNIPNFALVRFYPASGTNVNTSFTVSPRGTGQPNNRAQFSITNTDAIADPSNVEFAALRARGSDFVFGTGKSGTGVIRPLMFSAGYMTDNATNVNQLVLATDGNVGIGTTPAAGIKLDVSGVARINPTGVNGGGLIQFYTPNVETGMSIKYPATGRADLRFNGQTLKLVAGLDSGPPPDTNGLVITKEGRVGIGTASPVYGKLSVDGGPGIAVYGRGDFYGLDGQGDIGVNGLGSTYGLQGNGTEAGVYGIGGFGVKGTGTTGMKGETSHEGGVGVWGQGFINKTTGVQGTTNGADSYAVRGTAYGDGWAGYFDGKVQVDGPLTATGNVCAANISCASDARLKQNVTNLKYGLDQLLRLRPVSWRWKSEPDGKPQMGLVAQEVERVLPELVLREADETKPLGLNYMALLPVAVKAIQEQQAQIKQQQKLIEQLQARVSQLEQTKRKKQAGRKRARR